MLALFWICQVYLLKHLNACFTLPKIGSILNGKILSPQLLLRAHLSFLFKCLFKVYFPAVPVLCYFPIMIFYSMAKHIVFESLFAKELILLSVQLRHWFWKIYDYLSQLHPLFVQITLHSSKVFQYKFSYNLWLLRRDWVNYTAISLFRLKI